jgi:hypothetical protein
MKLQNVLCCYFLRIRVQGCHRPYCPLQEHRYINPVHCPAPPSFCYVLPVFKSVYSRRLICLTVCISSTPTRRIFVKFYVRNFY